MLKINQDEPVEVDLSLLKALYKKEAKVHAHTRKIIAKTMRIFGFTYTEIGEVLDISRQGAEQLVKSIK